MTFYTTFGQTHKHPKTQEPLKDHYLEFETMDQEKVTRYMYDRFGQQWCNIYESDFFIKNHFPGGRYGNVINL